MCEIPAIIATTKDMTADERDVLTGRVENVLQRGAYTRAELLGLGKRTSASLSCNQGAQTNVQGD